MTVRVRADDWTLSSGAFIHRVGGRTLGIVGLGNIRRSLLRKAPGLLHVLTYDPTVPTATMRELGAEPARLRTLRARDAGGRRGPRVRR